MTEHSSAPVAATAKVYPRKVTGAHRRWKTAVLILMLAALCLGPWLRWDRGPGAPDQAFLFDFVAMRGYFLSIELWPQEFYFLTGLMVAAAVALFLVTALLGRIWCGFACPQTVWTDLFVWIEQAVEGDRNARIKLDAQPLSVAKVVKKVVKHLAWAGISLLTGLSFVFYFADAPTAFGALVRAEASGALTSFVALFSLSTYLMAGWAREQVCIYMCPWPRIQGAMIDQHSLIVAYDSARGEGRGHAKPGQSFAGRGQCVDCAICVQACPTGIDIRDGMQMACIGCGLCADACDGVMTRFGLPGKLVGWRALVSPPGAAAAPSARWFRRPRVVAYAAVLLAIGIVMAVAGGQRRRLELAVQHDRSPVAVALSDGSVRNDYTVKVTNRLRRPRILRLAVSGVEGGVVHVVGQQGTTLAAAADSVTTFRVSIQMAPPPGTVAVGLSVADDASGDQAGGSTMFIGDTLR